MIGLIFAAVLTLSGDKGTDETRCFSVSATPYKLSYEVTNEWDRFGQDGYTNIALQKCSDGSNAGINKLISIPNGETRTGKLTIRRTGRYFLAVAASGAWSVTGKGSAPKWVPKSGPGCCSSHGGSGNQCTSDGRLRCADRSVSPSCKCKRG